MSDKNPTPPLAKGADLIQMERFRQISEEGYTVEHDEDHEYELVDAARAYLESVHLDLDGRVRPVNFVPSMWPWEARYWKPTKVDPVRDLVKAGALIAAAIDALQAAEAEADSDD